jgi:hypothetical protein
VKHFLVAGILALAACKPGTPRPIPVAAEETIDQPTTVVYQAALQAFADQSLPIRSTDPDKGVLESEYFDVGQFEREVSGYTPAERSIRIRVMVGLDSVRVQDAHIAMQAIYSPFSDPESQTKRSERAIPKSHPGMEIVKALMAAVKEKTKHN